MPSSNTTWCVIGYNNRHGLWGSDRMKSRITTDTTSKRGPRKPASNYDLLPGEHFGFSEKRFRAPASNEELNSRYAKGDIRIVTESARYSLAGILSMLKEEVPVDGQTGGEKEKRYKLDPEYQRRHRWSNQRKSKLIESFLINIPVPPVFLYERDLARFEVMDGRQRLTALADFYDNAFALEELEYWPELNGRYYSDLPSRVRDGIDRRYISSIILLKETAATEEQAAFLKKIVFERLNSGGVALSAQETRNAVYGGPLNQLCLQLSANEKFRAMWGIPDHVEALQDGSGDETGGSTDEPEPHTPTRSGQLMFEKMEDVELVLRFFAYRHIQRAKSGGLNKISEFLDGFLESGNRFGRLILDAYDQKFNDTINFLYECLGEEAFSVIAAKPSRPTKIIYDPIMYAANSPDVVKTWPQIVKRKEVLRQALANMYAADRANPRPSFAGRRTNSSDIVDRNAAMKAMFDEVLKQIRS